jgi:hypothetical protein
MPKKPQNSWKMLGSDSYAMRRQCKKIIIKSIPLIKNKCVYAELSLSSLKHNERKLTLPYTLQDKQHTDILLIRNAHSICFYYLRYADNAGLKTNTTS